MLLAPRLVVTLGDKATRAFEESRVPIGAVSILHPEKHGRRRLDHSEHEGWLERVSAALGLTWRDLTVRAAPVRRALVRDAWCDDPDR
jgi:hypothetical protein